MSAVIDLADSCRVTSSGLELHVEMTGIYVDNFKFETLPSSADGYNRLIISKSGCNRGGRSFLWIDSLADFNSV